MGLVRKFNFFSCVTVINLLHQLIYRRNRTIGLLHSNNIVVGYIIFSFFPNFTSALNSSYIFGLSGSVITVLVGVAIGIITCICTLALVLLLYRRFQRRKLKNNVLMHEEISRHEFLRQLDELRPQAEYFLQMLNDTRRQVRKLHLSGDPQAVTYNPMISDLAKILILLNKPVQLISNPPQDWYRLYTWAERLDCYKPQIEQLIEFLQSPSITDTRLSSSQHFTFKSHLPPSTNVPINSQAQHLLQSLISLHELEEEFTENNPQFNAVSNEETFGDTFKHVNDYLSSSPERTSAIWLEDEFFRLGQRPQDELTTEL